MDTASVKIIQFLTQLESRLEAAAAVLEAIGIEWSEVEDLTERAAREGREITQDEIQAFADQAQEALDNL